MTRVLRYYSSADVLFFVFDMCDVGTSRFVIDGLAFSMMCIVGVSFAYMVFMSIHMCRIDNRVTPNYPTPTRTPETINSQFHLDAGLTRRASLVGLQTSLASSSVEDITTF